METRAEIISKICNIHDTMGVITEEDIAICMKIYAEQALDLAASKALLSVFMAGAPYPTLEHSYRFGTTSVAVDTESILKLKDQLK